MISSRKGEEFGSTKGKEIGIVSMETILWEEELRSVTFGLTKISFNDNDGIVEGFFFEIFTTSKKFGKSLKMIQRWKFKLGKRELCFKEYDISTKIHYAFTRKEFVSLIPRDIP